MIFALREKFVDKVIKPDLLKDAENVDCLRLVFFKELLLARKTISGCISKIAENEKKAIY
ncbi:hypothetical protein [uncultured Succinivibrio sp.]|uniref:hypothetical protein n=1 Tax=uncultured Succinivibrio sp. TaxID=540749 RepID=UPI0025CF49C4|nr:hypothetical protein [uncultured Succinivibrio sp.]